MYPKLDSATLILNICPIIYLKELSLENESFTSAVDSTHGQSNYDFEVTSSATQVFRQAVFIKQLNLSKKSTKLLASRQERKNFTWCIQQFSRLFFFFCTDI